MADPKNYFAGESPDTAPNYFTPPQQDLTSELCELCMRFGALHEALNIMESMTEAKASPVVLAPMGMHLITLYFSCCDLLDKFRQHGADDEQVAEFRKTLAAERRRMQHE